MACSQFLEIPVAAMLDELTIEANEESFVIVLQHDVTCKRSIDGLQSVPRDSNDEEVAAMLDELTIEANDESSNMAAMTSHITDP